MKHLSRFVALVAVALFAAGCANRLSVRGNDARDLAGYRSWAWHGGPQFEGATARPEVAAEVGTLLAEGLAERGYSQVAANESPDLLVTFELSVVAKDQLRTNAPAQEQLNSSSAVGNQTFVLERTSLVRHVPYEDATLSVEIRDAADDVIVWSAVKHREVRGEFRPHVVETLAELFEHVPARSAGG